MAESPDFLQLAASVGELAKSLQQSLVEEHLPVPSAAANGRKDWSDTYSYPQILAARAELIDKTQQLLNLALGPVEQLAAYSGSLLSEVDVLRTLNALHVFESVPLEGEISVEDLAARIEVCNLKAFKKHLKFAYLMGLFRETDSGAVEHTSLSAALSSSSDWIEWRMGKLASNGAFEVANALRTGRGARELDAVPCRLADPRGRGFWDQLEADPDRRGMELYSTAMKGLLAHHSGGSLATLIRSFDWEALGPGATVVDVGGGNGHIEVEIAPSIENVSFVVQDVPSNCNAATGLIDANGLSDRVYFQQHDFFTAQPQLPNGQSPRAYLLIRVLQDWPDKDCVRILTRLADAMQQSGAKLWIVGRILPDEVGQMPVYKEKLLRNLDLLCFTLHGGGERSVKDLERIFAQANAKMRISKIVRPPYSVLSLMEVVLD